VAPMHRKRSAVMSIFDVQKYSEAFLHVVGCLKKKRFRLPDDWKSMLIRFYMLSANISGFWMTVHGF